MVVKCISFITFHKVYNILSYTLFTNNELSCTEHCLKLIMKTIFIFPFQKILKAIWKCPPARKCSICYKMLQNKSNACYIFSIPIRSWPRNALGNVAYCKEWYQLCNMCSSDISYNWRMVQLTNKQTDKLAVYVYWEFM